MKPQNLEEKVVWYTLTGTYGLYFLGAQIVVVPAMAWFLTLYLAKKLWNQTEDTPATEKITIPFVVWVWLISMVIMEVALIKGHIDFELGIPKIITSSIFVFAKVIVLLALFPLIGCLKIRPQLIYRAVCIVCLQSLIFIAVCYLASRLNLPASLYSSPMRIIGRGGDIFYSVGLYGIDPDSQEIRLTLFAPWPPALGLVGNIYFFLALQESNNKWRWIGIIGAIAMSMVSVSRLGMLCFPIVLLLTWLLTNFTRPFTQFTAGVVSVLTGMFAPLLLDWIKTLKATFASARASSSKVRDDLQNIGLYRWQTEAPIWGHGDIEPGPKVVQGMPIGSHHTWVGLLFTKGLVGFIALAVPLLLSFIELLIKSQKSKTASAGLSIILVLFFFTFAEVIEGLTYLYWPGLLIMGIAFKEAVYFNKSEAYITQGKG